MDLRRILNVGYAHLTADISADARRRINEDLNEPFPDELDEKARKRLEYRRKAREIGADIGQKKLMGAFAMKTTTRGSRV